MLRLLLTIIVSIFTFYMTGLLVGVLLPGGLGLIPFLVALPAAYFAGRYTWARSPSAADGPGRMIIQGAFLVGAIGFVGGFFGPMIFAPGANQGPLLGIFITGPLGFLAGGLGGLAYWWIRRVPPDAR